MTGYDPYASEGTRDLCHEYPEAEDALRRHRHRQAVRAAREVAQRQHQEAILGWLRQSNAELERERGTSDGD